MRLLLPLNHSSVALISLGVIISKLLLGRSIMKPRAAKAEVSNENEGGLKVHINLTPSEL